MALAVSGASDVEQSRWRAQLQQPVSPLAVLAGQRRHASGEIGWEKIRPMGQGAVVAMLPGGRLHLQHGPIDIVAKAWGTSCALKAGHVRAAGRFASILEELVAELAALRSDDVPVRGAVARRMEAAVAPFRPAFITPMAAVAGAVAEEVLAALVGQGIDRAYVNNGGDIALWLGPHERLTCALAAGGGLDRVTVRQADPVRGIATSGWRGRSQSLGIADAVTVLAPTAAMADAAATMIANAVDIDLPGIERRPARSLKSDSDLGDLLVTVGVPPLSADARAQALMAGVLAAESFRTRGLIAGAALFLQGERRITGALALNGQGEDAGV